MLATRIAQVLRLGTDRTLGFDAAQFGPNCLVLLSTWEWYAGPFQVSKTFYRPIC